MRTWTPIALIAGLLLAGCSFVVGKDGKPCENDLDCGDLHCIAGACTDEPACTDECSPEGSKRCDPDGPDVQLCSRNLDTCLNWIPDPENDCAADQHCDPDDFTCAAGCASYCTDGERRCTQDDWTEVCIEVPQGSYCWVWQTQTDCSANGQTCNQGRCVGGEGSCDDGILNQDETDVDCGGEICAGCANGKACIYPPDCLSEHCDNGTCRTAPTCSDFIENQDETDVDCGGITCSPCEDGATCEVDGDCLSDTCDNGTCAEANHCNNGSMDSGETDVDCGGPCGATCEIDDDCVLNSDCLSAYCPAGTCQQVPLSRSFDMPEMDQQIDHALAVAFYATRNPAGDHRLATGSSHGRPRVWAVPGDPASAVTEVPTLDDNFLHGPDEVASVAFQRGGQDGEDYLFTADALRGAYRIRVSSWVKRTFQSFGGSVVVAPPDSGAFIAAGEHIGGAGLSQIDVWDGTGDGGFSEELAILELGAQVHSLAFSPLLDPSGYYLAAGSESPGGSDPGLKVWHSDDWSAYPAELAFGIPVLDVAFSPDGLLLGYISDHPDQDPLFGIISTGNWNSVAGETISDLTTIAFVPGMPLAFAGTSTGMIYPVCNRGSGWQTRNSFQAHYPNPVHDLAVSEDGKWLASGSSGRVTVWYIPRLADENGCDGL